MHYPDGDNIITDNDGASWFTDGPPATTLKADVMNALVGELANILKAYNIPIKNSGNDTFDQIATALIARDQGKTREASVVIASSDSDENARLTADVVISTNEDFPTKLNIQISELASRGGGKIFLAKGTYNVVSNISIVYSDNIQIEGEDRNTVIIDSRYSTYIPGQWLINFTGISNVILKSLTIKNQITAPPSGTIYALFNINSYIEDVTIEHNGGNYAFGYCNNMINCGVILNYCTACSGFNLCDNLTNCYVKNNTVSVSEIGFESCRYVTSSIAESCYIGFTGTISRGGLSSCVAKTCAYGFNSCYYLSSCISDRSNVRGFTSCYGVNACLSNNSTASAGLGYKDCHGFMGNRATIILSGFTSCTPEWGSSANAAADTAAGGWNLFS